MIRCKKCQHSEINNLVGKCFEKKSNVWKNKTLEQSIQKQMDFKKPYNTKQMNRVQNN